LKNRLRLTAQKYLVSRLRPLWKRLRASDATGIALAIIVGLLAGLGAVVFRWLIKDFQRLFFRQGAVWFGSLGNYYVILLPVLGGLLFGPLIYFLAREAKGEGPPEVMEAIAVKGGRIRARVGAIKTIASSICIGSGGSVGREGPIVQIGSSVGSAIGQWLRLSEDWVKTLVLCGAAGGISATFNAPIGGVFFALEVIQRRFIAANLGFVVISSVTADFIAHRFLGTTPSFSISTYSMASNWEILPYALLGILAGVGSFIFIRFFYRCEDFFASFRLPEYLKPALGGIVIGLIGFYYFDVFGVGYGGSYGVGGLFVREGGVDKALIGEIGLATLLIILTLKMVATSVTLGSGGSGGIFAPSLFMGAMLGGAFGIIVYRLFPTIAVPSEAEASGAYALVGMGAFFAATVHGPITAIVMLFEMTRNYDLILPLMTAVIISMLTARAFSRESIYTMELVRRGVDIHREEQADIMRDITVGEVMTRDFPTVLPSMPVSQLMEELHESGHHGFPVADESGNFCGVVTLQDVEAALSRQDTTLTACDIATQSPIVAYPDQSIHDALAQFGGRDVGRIPVVDRDNPKKLLGVLRRHDVIKAYTKAVAKRVVKEDK
jgi:CIC family chloride channel protein